MNNYDIAKKLYKNKKSLRTIENETGISRKILSKKFKEDGISINWGINNKTLNKAVKMLEAGISKRQICLRLNIEKHTFNNKLKELNIYKPSNKGGTRNTSYDNEILIMYKENMSIEKISKKLQVSTNLVWHCLKENNYIKNNYNIYNYNTDIFEKIDNEEKAYWLGFLYADGYINLQKGVELTLCEKDKNHLEKFKDFINPDYKLKYRINVKAYRISICSVKIANDLNKLGCMQTKSLILKFPSYKQVPKKLIHHFMRGYFDGDGSVFLNKPSKGNGTKIQCGISILGTKEFLDEFDKILFNECKLTHKNKYGRCGEAYQLRRGGNLQTKKIFNYLYKDATIYLDRKYARFCRLESKDTEDSR